jgi:thioredoxin-related protein
VKVSASLFGLSLWFMLASTGFAEELRSPSAFFDQSFGDLQEEAEQAREEGKLGVLLMFETDDCPWCKRMKETVLNRARVQDLYRENFRIISLNTEGGTPVVGFDGNEVMEKDFALKYNRVRATPVFAFFDSDGELLASYTGAVKNVDEFMLLGEYVIGGHYKDLRFNAYKRTRPGS